jgi:CRP-like cAMP-binding protein
MTQLSLRNYAKSALIPLLSDALWLIESGIVRTSICTEQGKVTALGYWTAGDLVGQPLCQNDTFQIECITTVVASPVLRDEWPSHAPALIRYGQLTTELMSYIINQNTNQRLVHILRWLSARFGIQTAEGLLIDLPLTHYTIAELTGTTRVTATRLIGQMAREGLLLKCPKSYLVLKDLDRMRRIE